MLRRRLSLSLTALFFYLLVAAPVHTTAQPSKDAKHAAKIRKRVAEHFVNGEHHVTVKLRSGKELRGYIHHSGANSFLLKTFYSNTEIAVAYSDVAKIRNAEGLSSGEKVGIAVYAITVLDLRS